MTPDEFRNLALSMPEAIESSHMGHPDFRVRLSDTKTRIFASLFVPGGEEHGCQWGMVKLTPQLQREFIKAHPGVFEAVKGGWGQHGATQVRLDADGRSHARAPQRKSAAKAVRSAMIAAWREVAPKRLIAEPD